MKAYIVGAGAVGTYLGDLLQSISVEVTYAPRDIAAVTPVDADVVLVCVKAFDTDSAIQTLRAAIPYPQKCVFVTPQNGVGNEEKLAAAFGTDNVVAAALTTPVDRARDNGHGKAAKEGGIAFAPMGNNAYNWLTATFASGGIKVQVVDDWRALKWSKLALNVVANASCAILNVLPNRLVHFEEVFTLEIRAIREVRAVMQAMNVTPMDLPRYPVRALQGIATLPSPIARRLLAGRVAGARGTKPPSLLSDLRAGKAQTEVDYLNGAVACAGRDNGVPVPVNAVYARVLEDIAHMPQLWAKYRERPDTLASEVEAEVKRTRALARS
ncbi:MAG TPA: ketopantoate reductase C-terminal domain-containing protein [Candidatus Baltobacteraceae bacterium]|jgi:2-dehydropantoate 2-reductase|nr:ketopantoate reductase C-terminal domain-containing protein [Candidatus Baltobacteraceae bacterium]